MSDGPLKTPEQLARERQQALQSARQRPGSPPVPTSGGRTRGVVDFKQAAQDAKQLNRESPMQRAELQEGDGWQTRARALIKTDDTGTPLATVKRSVDMTTAEAYGPQSKNAISVINKYFARQECSEIHFSGPDALFAKVDGQRIQIAAEFSTVEEYNRFVEDLIHQADTTISLDDIRKRARSVVRMAGGDRMAILMPPLTEHISAAVHKVVARSWDMRTLVENGTCTPQMADFLQAAVRAKANMLVCGEMGAGKSVMLSLLVGQIAENERIALVEEVPEIFVDLPDVVRITYYPESMTESPMGLSEVIDTLLYMRMDRVIVGEIHDKGMYKMLRVMMTGSDGSLSTFHAGTVDQALEQVKNHVLLEHSSLPASVVSHLIRQAINVVVVLERVDGVHRVVEVAEVEWRNLTEGNDTVGKSMLYRFDRRDKEFKTVGRLDEQGKVAEKARKHGIIMRPEWFAGASYGVRDR